MGEKWWPNGAWDMHPGFFYMPQICDMGPIILLPFQRKACWGFLSPIKNPTASARFEPANLGIRSQHATSAPPKPLLRSMVWLDLHIQRGLYQNYIAHNKNLTAFSVESEKQMSDI